MKTANAKGAVPSRRKVMGDVRIDSPAGASVPRMIALVGNRKKKAEARPFFVLNALTSARGQSFISTGR